MSPIKAASDPYGDDGPEHEATIGELLDKAVEAISRRDRATGAPPVETSVGAETVAPETGEGIDLLSFAPDHSGEIRRLTILFVELVDFTAISARLDPEHYRLLVGGYHKTVRRCVERYDGHIAATKGEGLLAVFGHPVAHEDDVRRAVKAGLDIVREMRAVSERSVGRIGAPAEVRVGVHRDVVYLDIAEDDVYGLAANVAARVCSLARPGWVVVSEAVESLTRDLFETEVCAPAAVKGVDVPLAHHRVVGERPPLRRIASTPLVGREHEIARIEDSWSQVRTGSRTTAGVVLRGEPGIGKSRVASVIAERVRSDGAQVIELYGSPLHTGVGLHPVRTLLEHRCGISRLIAGAERLRLLSNELAQAGLDTAEMLPLLAPVLGIAPEDGYQPVAALGPQLQAMISAAVSRYLYACLRAGPGLVIAEDAQWFDSSTRDVLGALLLAEQGRLLMVITARDTDGLLPALPVQVLDLAPLTAAECDDLVTILDPSVTTAQRDQIRTRCDGVPFYIEQVVGELGLEPPETTSKTPVPEILYEPLRARLPQHPDLVRVTRAAAVIGRSVDRSLLAAVADLDAERLDQLIDDLQEARVFERSGSDTWLFRHELLREVAAELTPPSVSQILHARAADALVHGTAGDPDWPVVAVHNREAGRHDTAATAYVAASAGARRRGALGEARAYLDLAVTELSLCPPSSDRDRLEIATRLQRGYLAAAAEPEGNLSPLSVADFETCLQLVGTDVHDELMVVTLIAATAHYIWATELDRAEQLVEVLRRDTDPQPPWLDRATNAGAGVVAFLHGEFVSASESFERATAALTRGSDIDGLWAIPTDPVAWSYVFLAVIRVLNGDTIDSETRLDLALQRARRLMFPLNTYNEVWAIRNEIWIRAEAGQLDRAGAIAAQLTEQAGRHGFRYWHQFGLDEQTAINARIALASNASDRHDLSARADTMIAIENRYRRIGVAYRPINDALTGSLLIAAGRHGEARDWLDDTLASNARTGQCFYDAELTRIRAHASVDPDERASGFATAAALARRQGAPLFELRAALDHHDLIGPPAGDALRAALARQVAGDGLPEIARARKALGG